MTDFLKKAYLAGLGLFEATKEKVETLADDLIKKGEIALQDKKPFVEQVIDQVEKTRQETQNFIKKEMQKVFSTLDLPTRSEFEEIKKRLSELEEKIK